MRSAAQTALAPTGFDHALQRVSALRVRQRRELAELVGFETRNKYAIESEDGRPLGFAAEQGKGFLGFLLRQFLGHWRPFEVTVFDEARQPVLTARHPFRIWFQRLDIQSADGTPMGALQQRWAVFSKKFDVLDAHGQVLLTVSSPLWRVWTFPFRRGDSQVAVVQKRWSGLVREAFTDADDFRVEFSDSQLSSRERALVLTAAIFVDLVYFEHKAH